MILSRYNFIYSNFNQNRAGNYTYKMISLFLAVLLSFLSFYLCIVFLDDPTVSAVTVVLFLYCNFAYFVVGVSENDRNTLPNTYIYNGKTHGEFHSAPELTFKTPICCQENQKFYSYDYEKCLLSYFNYTEWKRQVFERSNEKSILEKSFLKIVFFYAFPFIVFLFLVKQWFFFVFPACIFCWFVFGVNFVCIPKNKQTEVKINEEQFGKDFIISTIISKPEDFIAFFDLDEKSVDFLVSDIINTTAAEAELYKKIGNKKTELILHSVTLSLVPILFIVIAIALA